MAQSDGNGFTMSDAEKNGQKTLPKISFSSFILSLYSTGLVQLGKVEDPSTGGKSVNLELAQHTIDMIAMLEEKTSGNLNEEETNLVKALLSELRMAYVEVRP